MSLFIFASVISYILFGIYLLEKGYFFRSETPIPKIERRQVLMSIPIEDFGVNQTSEVKFVKIQNPRIKVCSDSNECYEIDTIGNSMFHKVDEQEVKKAEPCYLALPLGDEDKFDENKFDEDKFDEDKFDENKFDEDKFDENNN